MPFVLIVSLAGCANFSDDRTRTQMEGAGAGAALGAGAGALMGKTKAPNGAGVGALAGGPVGGIAGAAYGNSVANKKGEYAKVEAALDARLARIEQETGQRRQYNADLAKVIQRTKRKSAAILAAGDPRGTAADQRELRASVASSVKQVDRDLRTWQGVIDEHKAAHTRLAREKRATELQEGIDKLSKERKRLQLQREELSEIGAGPAK